MPLTDLTLPNAKPKEKPYKLYDTRGLYGLMSVTGVICFRQKYYINGKEKVVALGIYPEVSLAIAREQRDANRALLAKGIDPGDLKQQKKRIKGTAMAASFEVIAREWFVKFSSEWSEDYKARVLRISERDIFPWIGKKAISELMPPDVLGILRRIEERGAKETVHRAKQICSQVFRYALASGRVDRDITCTSFDLM